jgi:hypothetical protein
MELIIYGNLNEFLSLFMNNMDKMSAADFKKVNNQFGLWEYYP